MTRSLRLRLAAFAAVVAAVVAALLLGPLRPASAAASSDAVPGVGQAGSDRVLVTLSGIDDKGLQALSYEASLTKPVASGQPTGKAVFSPVVFRHAFDASSPRIALAAAENRRVKTAVFTAYRASGVAKLRITLQDVTIQGVRQYLPDVNADERLVARVPLLEEVSLLYRAIEWCSYASDQGPPVCTSFDVTAGR